MSRDPLRVAVPDEPGERVPAAEVTPTPNNGGLTEVDPPPACPPEVSRRAAGNGITYCLPAGEPGSTCTPEPGLEAADAEPAVANESTVNTVKNIADLPARMVRD
ncbi:MAG: hypothetical protein WCB67_05055 [Solirubrobacteraceae bacterium]